MVLGGAAGSAQRSFPGVVRAAQRVDLAFQVAGQLIEFDVKEGQQVDVGAVLGRLDARDYASSAKAAEARLTEAQSNFRRAAELLEKKFISESQYDGLKAARDVAQSQVEVARKALEDTELLAPFTGVVARTYVENFQDIQAKQPVLSLQDNSSLEVVVNIAETLLARSENVDDLEVYGWLDARPDVRIKAWLKEFATEADPKTQTYRYVLGLEDTEGLKILPGMTLSIEANARVSHDDQQRFTIPVAALVADEAGQSSVWLVDGENKVYRQEVGTGDLSGTDQIQILEGLKAGDKLIIAGANAMYAGREVKPVPELVFK
jgi:RND family efflux transporter MFP subunit